MATYLYRLGKLAYRRKGVFLAAWLSLLVLMGVAAATLAQPSKDSFSIPGTPAQAAQDLMSERFPGAADPFNSLTARYVFAAPEGQTLDTPENQAAMDAVLTNIRGIDQVADSAKADPGTQGALANPVAAADDLAAQFTDRATENGTSVQDAQRDAAALSPLSPDRTVGYLDVPVTGSFGDVTDELRATLADAVGPAEDAGLTVYVTGSATTTQEPPGGTSELIGIAVAAVVLTITFGSLVAAGMPLLTAIIGVGISVSAITAATGFIELGSMTPTLAIMIGLAVAIDYSLFILSRYRHELTVAPTREEAVGRAVGTAGSAVVFAGLTVIIALLALRVVNIPFLTDMGGAAAFAVLMAVLIALTLLPALLGVFKSKAFAGRVPLVKSTDPEAGGRTTNGLRWARFVVKAPVLTLVGGVVLLLALAVPASGLKLALPNESMQEPGTPARSAFELVDESFGPGKNGPLLVVVDAQGAPEDQRGEAFGRVVDTIYAQGDVANAQIVGMNEAGDTAQILVTPTSGPSSDETKQLLERIRAAEPALADELGVTYGVTGQTALEGDISERLQDALIPYLLVVVGLAFLLLTLVFRSILVPLTATLGFLLSVAATFGATVVIFQNGWGGIIDNPQPIVSFMPIFLIGVVFGLAMDYQVFLVSRMREEYVHGATAKEAIVSGFQHGARVVTAAALIMMSVFAAFIAEPDSFIKSIGFALAAAVFFDAFIVRMVVIPSIMALLGDKAWWLPKWLDKALPNVDIEGEKLARSLAPAKKAEPEPATV